MDVGTQRVMNAKYLLSTVAGVVIGALLMSFVVPLRSSAEVQTPGITATRYQDDAYVPARPVSQVRTARTVPASRVSYAPVSARTASAQRVDARRSWKKTALVIGGSAGAGAGVGAIAGGKKGALIGAAIGGGGASLFEAIKRR